MGGGVIMLTGEVLAHGFNHVIGLAKAEMEKMKTEGALEDRSSANALRKWYLLKSIVIMFEAVITFAKRHAELARELAAKTSDPVRKAELLKIAEVCERVPAEPPRDFWEAVQSVRFMHLAAWKESPERAEVGIGRIDQFWYPYYKPTSRRQAHRRPELIGAMAQDPRGRAVTIRRSTAPRPAASCRTSPCAAATRTAWTSPTSCLGDPRVMAQVHLSSRPCTCYHEDRTSFIIRALKQP
jgi:hypothetical protein